MTPDAILTALADPTRRAILDRMREGERPVGVIAEDLPVTRPAVSQHLKLMTEAGLITMRRDGRRNLYGLAPGGASALVDWLGALSESPVDDAAGGLRRSLSVRLSPEETWALFCEDLALWWPVAEVSVSARDDGALPMSVVLNLDAGTLIETKFDGSEHLWAKVAQVTPEGGRICFDWRLGTPEGSTVEVRIQAEPGGARLTLTQDADTDDLAALWDLVLMERFAAAAAASLSNF